MRNKSLRWTAGFCLFMVALGFLGAQGVARIPFADDDTLEEIRAKIEANGYHFTVAHNRVFDMSPRERAAFHSRHPSRLRHGRNGEDVGPLKDVLGRVALPTRFDWRNVGGHSYIGPVRDQGGCGSCYAFGACAAAEGTYNYANNLVDAACADFSESFVIWCLGSLAEYSAHFGGCSGADFDYMELQALVDRGVCSESAFPYSESDPGGCTHWDDPLVRFANWYRVPCGDIDAIKTAIMTYGVVDAAVTVSSAFDAYSGGIYEDSSTACYSDPCYYTPTNHAIALVGWDDAEGVFILRNSWNTGWGEGGYMRISYHAARVACEVTYLVYESSGCLASLSPAAESFAASGGAGAFRIATGADCSWNAAKTVSWITLGATSSGTGPGEVGYTVKPNTGQTSRKGYIRVTTGDQTAEFEVRQAAESADGPVITAQIAPESYDFGQKATLAVIAEGENPLEYQWYEGEAGNTARPVEGAVESRFTFTVTRSTGYWVRVKNAQGQADSAAFPIVPSGNLVVGHLPSLSGWWSRIILVNTGGSEADVRLEAMAPDGTCLEQKSWGPLPAGARAVIDPAALFLEATLRQNVWVRVRSAVRLQGAVEFGTDDGKARMQLTLDDARGDTELIYPHVYTRPGVADSFYTGITLVNLSPGAAEVVVDAYSENSGQVTSTSLTIPAGGKVAGLLEDFFPGFAAPETIRSLRVHSSAAVTGFASFGKLGDHGLSGLNAIPLQQHDWGASTEGYTLVYGDIPADSDWFTGVTFSNVSGRTSYFDLRAWNAQGELVKSRSLSLAPAQEKSGEVWEIFGRKYPTAAWFHLSTPERMLGFEIFVSRQAAFRLDGFNAFSTGFRKGCFPMTSTPLNEVSRLRVINISSASADIAVKAWNDAGQPVGGTSATLASKAVLDLDLGAAQGLGLPQATWFTVESTGDCVAHLFSLSPDGQSLLCCQALPVE